MFHLNRSLIRPVPFGVLLSAAVVLFGCSTSREPGISKAKRVDLSLAMLDTGDFRYPVETIQSNVSLPQKYPVGACRVVVHSLHGLGRIWGAPSGPPMPSPVQNVFELRRTDPITFVENVARVASDPKCQQAGFLPLEVRVSRSLDGSIESVEQRFFDLASGAQSVTMLATECFLSILIYEPIDSLPLDLHADLKEYVAKMHTRLATLNKSYCPKR